MVTVLEVSVATARVDLYCRVEEITSLTKVVDEKLDQVEAICANAARMMATYLALFSVRSP